MIGLRLYTALWYIALPIIILRLFWRSFKAVDYRRNIFERLGFINTVNSDKPCLWIHAVSLGESIAATALIRSLLKAGQYHLLITNTTPTGRARIQQEFGSSVSQAWAPYDLPASIERFIQRAKPCGLIIMETELWPNWLAICRKHNIPSLLANGRLSASSCRGYQRFAALSARMMEDINVLTVQTEQHAERFASLGAHHTKILVAGNIKFDVQLDDALISKAQASKLHLAGRPTLIAGSTHDGEDEIILAAFAQILKESPQTLLILVPRHPERFDSVATLIRSEGFTLARRSTDNLPNAQQQILLGDTLGELTLLYGLADGAFIGGSLIKRGGHNMLEAALWGIPLATGPFMDNFAQLYADLSACGALTTVSSAHELAVFFLGCQSDPSRAKFMGAAGHAYLIGNQGALTKIQQAINHLLTSNATLK